MARWLVCSVGACLALVQTDIKKVIAYSSISHLGYVMLGLVSLDLLGIQGAIIQMVSHGLTAAGLFFLVGMVYERCHTRDIAAYGGLAKLMPAYSVFFAILTLAAVGLPTTSGFTGEFLVLLGAFSAAWPQHQAGSSYSLVMAVTAVSGVVLGAMYMLWLAQRMLFGAAKAPHLPLADINAREKTILVILVAPWAGRLSDRVGSRWLMAGGMVLLAVQLAYFSQLGTDSSFWSLLPGLVIGGVGMSLTMTPASAAAMRAVPVEKAGVGSAVLNACRQVGGSMGIALMGAIMASQLATPPTAESFMRGFERSLLVAAAIALVGSVVAAWLVRSHDSEAHGVGEARSVPAEAA